MDFVTGISISTDWKGNSYNFILVIVDWLTKMLYYEPVKTTINIASLAEGYPRYGSAAPWLFRFSRDK